VRGERSLELALTGRIGTSWNTKRSPSSKDGPMSDISDAADLLATAREALAHELLPLLPKERRYVGLMIGNVIGIAIRELQAARPAMAAKRNGRGTGRRRRHPAPAHTEPGAGGAEGAASRAVARPFAPAASTSQPQALR